MLRLLRSFFLCLLSAASLVALTPTAFGEIRAVELKDGDRIATIGGAFVERDQMYGYLETLLTIANPDKNLTFRNLGWSGDTVEGHARAVFGGPQDGFQRLLKDLKDAKPTLILVCYGANEAHAGEAGLAAFEANYQRLLDEIAKATDARLALVTPHRHEFVDKRLPDPNLYNNKLPIYVGAIKKLADQRFSALVDLSDLIPSSSSPNKPSVNRLTDNGVHFSDQGYWKIAPQIAERMGVRLAAIDVVIDMETKSQQATGAKVSELTIADDKITFRALADHLPLPPSPRPDASFPAAGVLRITVKGLAKDRSWKVLCDGQPVTLTGDSALEHGALILETAESAQTEKLRETINYKDELWFHRHRPQNETYLFLFRKHEQGNNAIEIPQFDPLIAAEEAKIAELKKPQPHTFEIKLK